MKNDFYSQIIGIDIILKENAIILPQQRISSKPLMDPNDSKVGVDFQIEARPQMNKISTWTHTTFLKEKHKFDWMLVGAYIQKWHYLKTFGRLPILNF